MVATVPRMTIRRLCQPMSSPTSHRACSTHRCAGIPDLILEAPGSIASELNLVGTVNKNLINLPLIGIRPLQMANLLHADT